MAANNVLVKDLQGVETLGQFKSFRFVIFRPNSRCAGSVCFMTNLLKTLKTNSWTTLAHALGYRQNWDVDKKPDDSRPPFSILPEFSYRLNILMKVTNLWNGEKMYSAFQVATTPFIISCKPS